MQQMTYSEEREVTKIMENYREMAANGQLPPKPKERMHIEYVPVSPQEQISFKDVWQEIKAMFSSKP